MKNYRRAALKKIAITSGAIGIAANTGLSKDITKVIEDCNCIYPYKGPKGAYFTNAVVKTHDRGKVMFYKDLLAEKIVMVNFMSITSDTEFRSTAKLLEVQNILGKRLGRDYFIYSISTDPVNDTLPKLQLFAQKHGVKEGWSFITGTEKVINGLKQRFFYADLSKPEHHKDLHDCSKGLMRYGNEKVGLWGSVAHSSPSDWIVKRLEWISTNKQPSKNPKRRGPIAIVDKKPWLYDSGNYTL